MDWVSRPADSYAPMAWFSVLISLKSFLESSGYMDISIATMGTNGEVSVTCCMPRRLLIAKRWRGALSLLPPWLVFERIDPERFLARAVVSDTSSSLAASCFSYMARAVRGPLMKCRSFARPI